MINPCTPFFLAPLGLLFLLWVSNHKFYRGPSNEHFLPRLILIGHVVSEKIEMLKFIDNNNDDQER